MLFYLFFVLILLFLGSMPHIKKLSFFEHFSLILILPFLLFNNDNPDYSAYEKIFFYDDPNGLAEFGFNYIIKLTKLYLSNNYIIIQFFLSLLIFFTFLRFKKYIKSLNYIILLYFLFPFFIDIIQIRNTFMFFLVLNAILEFSNGKTFRTFVILCMATTFHVNGFVYLLLFLFFLIFRTKNIKNLKISDVKYFKNKKFYNCIIFFGIINIFFGKSIISLIIKKSPITIITVKLNHYLINGFNIDSFIVWGLFLISDLIIFYKFLNSKEIQDHKNNNLIILLYFFMFSGLLLLGFMLHMNEFNRVFRSIFIIKYLLYGCIESLLPTQKKRILKFYLLLVSILLSSIYFYRGIEYDNIIINNSLFLFFSNFF